MFELSIACKYLLPRWRQLSVSIISLISIIVISLVVWLVLVFFSVTGGLEKIWVEKLISVTAPIRITPTDDYYSSYYYQIDSLSSSSDYSFKSIAEKLNSDTTDPYNPLHDEELPAHLPPKDTNPDGSLKDLVKLASEKILGIKGYKGLTVSDYQMSYANIRIRLLRGLKGKETPTHSFINHSVYLGTFDGSNSHFANTLLPLTNDDILNSYSMLGIGDNILEDNPHDFLQMQAKKAEEKKKAFLHDLGIENADIEDDVSLLASYAHNKVYDTPSSFWLFKTKNENNQLVYQLPFDNIAGEGIVIPKNFKEAGILIGDRGYLSYYAPTTSTVQEQRIPIFIAGFYDPGLVPLGGKYILVNPEIVNTIRNSHNPEDTTLANGINVRFDDISKAENLKKEIKNAFEEAGISKYWKVETYRDFDFSKDLLQQLNSEKNIFSLISGVIIIVACSNIISMMVILVNDKRLEIGILRSMGATSISIASIFGFSGMVMGLLGSFIGTILAFFTLRNIEFLIDLISKMQGFQAFNPLYYGSTLPHEISAEALIFVMSATVITSLLAGLIPAVKACSLKPASILRS